jgi:hypothetical protein
MIKFTPTLLEDQPQIARWSAADPYHCEKAAIAGPGWWVMGNSDALALFCVEDDGGPTIYMRLDKEEEWLRFHTQFAPENEVSKKRTIQTVIEGFPIIRAFARQRDLKGLVFESTSKSLIAFMSAQFDFKSIENTNDYVFKFEER